MSASKVTNPAAQVSEAQRAMEMKSAMPAAPHPSPGQTANEGMNPTPNAAAAPSGAFDAEGQRPVLERSRKVR